MILTAHRRSTIQEGSVMTAISTDAFYDALEKSKLLSSKQLSKVRKVNGEREPRSIARQLIRHGLLTNWQAATVLAGRYPMRLGNYTLVDLLHDGRLGKLYLGEHTQMGRKVAIKVLSAAHLQNKAVVKGFLAEARKLASLDHRNIVHVLDIAKDNDRYYLVLERVEGKDFEVLLKINDGPIDPTHTADLLKQALNGLSHAHTEGVVHGDLQPSNLILDDHGVVKVVDTGEALLLDEAARKESPYTAPEQQGAEVTAEARSDLFAIGRIGAFLLQGDATEEPANAPKALRAILDKLTAESPDDRYETAEEASQALAEWLRKTEMPAAKPPPPKKGAKPAAKKPAPKAAAAKAPAVKAAPPKKRDSGGFPGIVVAGAKPASVDEDPLAEDPLVDPIADDDPLGEAAALSEESPSSELDDLASMEEAGVAEETVAPVSETPGKDPVTPAKESSENKGPNWLIIGGIAGGVVACMLFSVIGAVAAVLLLSDDEPEVAVADPTTAAAPGDTEPSTSEVSDEPNDEPEDPPAEDTPADDPPADDPPAEAPADPAPMEPEADPMPPAAPADPAPADPPKATPPKPDPPKPAPPKPAPPKPAEPPKPADPFRQMKTDVVSLSDLTAAGEPGVAVLGKIILGKDQFLFAKLLGGDYAHESPKFSYEMRDVTGEDHHWQITMLSAGGDAMIADLNLEGQDLKLKWSPMADQNAAFLSNCALELVVTGGSEKMLKLRNAGATEPAQLELKATKTDFKIENPPSMEFVQVQVQPLAGEYAKQHVFDPKAEVSIGANDPVWLKIGPPGEEVLKFEIRATAKGKNIVVVSMKPFIQFPGQPRPEPYNLKKLGEYYKQLLAQNQFATQKMLALQKEKNQTPQIKAQIATITEGLAVLKKSIAQMDALEGIAKQLSPPPPGRKPAAGEEAAPQAPPVNLQFRLIYRFQGDFKSFELVLAE